MHFTPLFAQWFPKFKIAAKVIATDDIRLFVLGVTFCKQKVTYWRGCESRLKTTTVVIKKFPKINQVYRYTDISSSLIFKLVTIIITEAHTSKELNRQGKRVSRHKVWLCMQITWRYTFETRRFTFPFQKTFRNLKTFPGNKNASW